jgi:hypothetical protein
MRPLSERLRYIQLKGHLYFGDKEWVWVAAPDVKCEVRELRSESKFTVVELVYDILKGIKI